MTRLDEQARPVVVVVGAINVDMVVRADRLPGPGETVVGPRMHRHGGGKGANAAVAAARAGAVVRLVGAVGDDDSGTAATADLAAEGVDVSGVVVIPEQSTGVALIVVDAAGENQIAVGAGANVFMTARDVDGALRRALTGADCVLVSTEISPAVLTHAVELAVAAGVRCVLNPAPVTAEVVELLALGPVLTPNTTEGAQLAAMLGSPAPERTAAEAEPPPRVHAAELAAGAIVGRSGAACVVTLGGEGVFVLEPGVAGTHLPARPADVRDTTGAGDTFNGVLATRLAAGDPLATAVHTAVTAAALAVTAVGARAGMPDAVALATALQQHPVHR
ncbi:PfkB family carbohydrate kinase [Rhodococcus sp. X156]|uniref:PfkB family carbohydrate kinase n=1 Tax=Rhodococcus sp. X156 TaxID=2499145 RepID=UPI000FD95540|nr:PfkB family carbohydrate kinase [Rhodococcus sp. X156]